MLEFLPRILCMKGCKSQVAVEEDEESEAGFEIPIIGILDFLLQGIVESRILKLEITVTKIDPSSDLGKIHADLKYIADHMRQDDIEGDFEGDWKYAATVFDR